MNKNIFFTLTIMALLLGGCSRDGGNLPEVVQVKKITPYHKVSGDDTVESIAKKYGMKRSELIRLNKLEQPYHLYEGQRLIVVPRTDVEEPKTDADIVVSADKDELHDEQQADSETGQDGTELSAPSSEAVVTKSNYIWPIVDGKAKISQHFNNEGGIVIDASAGTPVKSIADGVVVIAGVPSGDAAAYGITVVVKHSSQKTMSIYANLKEATVNVKQKVKQGTIIGRVGKTGSIAAKPQLYFEINEISSQGRTAVDPEALLK